VVIRTYFGAGLRSARAMPPESAHISLSRHAKQALTPEQQTATSATATVRSNEHCASSTESYLTDFSDRFVFETINSK
jgi:hypothetical protein